MQTKLNTIEEAIADIKAGKVIIVVDDENRENEGDFLTAAENATPEIINFMATYGRGLICAPLTEERCKELNLNLMVGKNTAAYETNFTVSVDLVGHGCTTGISASDRSKTMLALVNPKTNPEELGRPGHIFPLIAKDGGVIRRAGHTEAAVDLARLAGMKPAGLLVEILKEDGEMARLPDLFKIAEQHQLKIISIEDLIAYRLTMDSLIKQEVSIDLPTAWGDFKMTAYTQLDNNATHLAISKGEWNANEPILARVHSSCVTGDIFGSCRCDCGPQLHKALEMIEKEGKGIVVYMNQEGRGIGLINKLRSYNLQDAGFDTVEANIKLGFKGDERDYGVGAQILRSEGVTKMRLMSNNPTKRAGLIGYGLEVVENIPIEIASNVHNERYLTTKRDKMGHSIMKG
ncbi:bifunctional 3,4-dihydroxy-2-butanone-4-phosphate synthase/GTP cyclohydrolase II [Pedobacter sp. ISL-68]|jgi:3,4-dihydroxy 2-butanone 4-phosphate synthase / GTP cyclohydrolase II|uniref:Riboflavin biosynthesis protein RibBA n=1 Tax=Pedobacter kyonggii TaxID=1926871 RepID=A0A4Q9H7H6_9SPHI|nr:MULTISPECIES: bifunctional 3,4-dihydroxy-2-butanone-4-phosphate synthase/GTP cyclohydrolase II [Pedobacter]MBT2562979.1 bifunctional 3,4-dihydroxy-2-butanone-4-phosphate synthase/GTP cyclohydrolase II [Pedobacter sp. ISL-64]MBT2592983.1 bifunctional 3,4-dihydroxy-2-butanone-4-phosphate synthase/GTP cyclohydrolase II [Pedobacter sp. ISL-68]TBO39776.1 bifunctional 3,4-dihydroxy-2-butanone-4-phosphate synthase/GTP cyclohydrolase II [Pedobacter kyonggii]CAH0173692.1 Riboflavin biosynthesis prote